MKSRFFACFAVFTAFWAGRLLAAGAGEQIVAKARAYLGTEAALNAITTIHFTGTLEIEPGKKMPVDIIFQKPYQQRITVTGSDVIETTALDGYDAWQKRTNLANRAQWQVTLLDAGQVKRLRANTWENLSFFGRLEKKGGKVVPGGDVTVDGHICAKVSFVHDKDIIFVRYFDKATGRLVKTETEDGGEIREEGEMIANGIRFPKRVVNKTPDGASTTIDFDRVELNRPVDAAEFAVPTF